MAKIRSHNEGTVYRLPNGKWRAQVSIDGRRLSFTAKTQKEGWAWVSETKIQINKGLTFKAAHTTLKEFLGEWLRTVSSSQSQGTYYTYTWTAEKRILPYIGNVNLMDLRPDLIQRFYNRLQNDGLSAHAVKVTHKTLSTAMKYAVKFGYLGRNPCSDAIPPLYKKRVMKFYDDEQSNSLLKTAKEIGDRLYLLYYLAIKTGMRQAELMGLKWEDVDWRLNTIYVNRQVRYFKGKSYSFSGPKSEKGIRAIMIDNKTLELLKKHKREQETLVNLLGSNWTSLDLIFPSGAGTPLTPSNIRRSFRKLLVASGLPKIRFHDLRHTAASLMLNYGVPVLIVSNRLGHANINITLDVYGHLIPSRQEEAVQVMDELICE